MGDIFYEDGDEDGGGFPSELVERSEGQNFAGRKAGGESASLAVAASLGASGGGLEALAQVSGAGLRTWDVFATARRTVAGATGIMAAVALVEWSIDGANFAAEVDVGQGARLCLAATWIRLSVRNEGTVAIIASGGIVPSEGGGPDCSMRTRYVPAVSSGNPITITIPEFAQWFTAGMQPNNAGSATGMDVFILDSAGTVIDQTRWGTAAGGQLTSESRNSRLALPNDARSLTLVAPSNAIDRIRVVFGLVI